MRSTAKYWEHVGPMKRGAAAEPARHGINDVHELNGGSGTAGASPANLARELRAALAMLDETQRTDLGRAAALAMRVVDLGQRCADTRLLADALAAAAHVFASRDEVYLCYPLAAEAQQLFESQGRAVEAGRMLNLRGVCFDIVGEAERALHLYGEALAMLRQAGDEIYVRRVLNNIGVVDLRQQSYTSAIECLTEAVARDEAQPSDPARWVHLCTLAEARAEYGNALAESGRAAESQEQVGEALRLLARLDSPAFDAEAVGIRAVCINVASRLHLLLGDLERGGCYTMRLWRIARHCGSPNYVAIAYARFAELRGMQRKVPKACRWRQRAEDALGRLQMKNELREMFERLAAITAKENAIDYALRFFKRGLQLRRETQTAGAATRSQLMALDREASHQRRRTQEALIHAGKMALVGSLVTSLNADLKGPLADTQALAADLREAFDRRDEAALRERLSNLLEAVDELRSMVQRLDVFCRKDGGLSGAVTLRAAMSEVLWIAGARYGTRVDAVRLDVTDEHVWCDVDRLILIVASVVDHLLRIEADAQGEVLIGSRATNDGVDLYVAFEGDVTDDVLLSRPLEKHAKEPVDGGALCLELTIAAEAALAIQTQLRSRTLGGGRGEYWLRLTSPKSIGEAAAKGAAEPPRDAHTRSVWRSLVKGKRVRSAQQ